MFPNDHVLNQFRYVSKTYVYNNIEQHIVEQISRSALLVPVASEYSVPIYSQVLYHMYNIVRETCFLTSRRQQYVRQCYTMNHGQHAGFFFHYRFLKCSTHTFHSTLLKY